MRGGGGGLLESMAFREDREGSCGIQVIVICMLSIHVFYRREAKCWLGDARSINGSMGRGTEWRDGRLLSRRPSPSCGLPSCWQVHLSLWKPGRNSPSVPRATEVGCLGRCWEARSVARGRALADVHLLFLSRPGLVGCQAHHSLTSSSGCRSRKCVRVCTYMCLCKCNAHVHVLLQTLVATRAVGDAHAMPCHVRRWRRRERDGRVRTVNVPSLPPFVRRPPRECQLGVQDLLGGSGLGL
ncbi:hypothetical protein B0T18DRAFT_39389 [Schizothecium vesticola]|uniref:Uncharacterized protein n=1 Tax=Schizothecium vesticola TaxID=314040 RepID=A0AA40FB61_9PEZI|nr:hypothetical protein B0T18DRAFT_39389 [Schizothecium vesticola]